MASELEGVAALEARLRALRADLQGPALRAAVRAAAKPVKERAAATVPKGRGLHKTYKGRLVGPGFASRSLTVVTKLGATAQRAFALIGVKREAFYAVSFLERGTSKMAARPWLVPAFEATRGAQLTALKDGLAKAIARAVRKAGRKR